jgi:hypothetical protein
VVSDLTMLDGAPARLAAVRRMELAGQDTERCRGDAAGLNDEPSVRTSRRRWPATS